MIDDDVLLQNLAGEYLRAHHYYVDMLSSGEELSGFLLKNTPDLIVLDIMLPGRNGLFWLEWLKNHFPSLPVLILSAKNSVDDRVTGLELGAADYLIKPFHLKELLMRIRNILRHQPKPASQLLRIGDGWFDAQRQRFIRNDRTIKLTVLETRLLEFFNKNIGQVLTRDAISFALRGAEHNPNDRSLDMHMNRLRKKIEDDPHNPRHINTVWGKGYCFTP